MTVEIERKFLLANDGWRAAAVSRDHLRDGLIIRSGGGGAKVRVRLGARHAWITVKGPRTGISRSEFEYEIPHADAEEMLRTLCAGPAVEKVRHTVPFGNLLWSVDIHMGPLEGVEFAEVELKDPNEFVPLPPWAGAEITNDPNFRKETLLRRCAEAAARPDRCLTAGYSSIA